MKIHRFSIERTTIGYEGIYYSIYDSWSGSQHVYLPKFHITMPDYLKWKAKGQIVEEYPRTIQIKLLDGKL